MSAADHYSLGYTQPSVDQLGFEGEHGAAYTIQSRFREKQQRKMWNRNRLSSRAQNAIVSAATRRRKTTLQLSVRLPPTTLRGKVWVFFNEPSSSGGAYCWAILILTIIVFSCGVFVVQVSTLNRLLSTFFRAGLRSHTDTSAVAQTHPSLHARHEATFHSIELCCVLVFTLEFLCRVGTCPSLRAFVGDLLNWIDLLAVVPFYIEQALQSSDGPPNPKPQPRSPLTVPAQPVFLFVRRFFKHAAVVGQVLGAWRSFV